MTILRHPITVFFGGVLAFMLAMWGYDAYRHRGGQSAFQQQADAAHDSTQAAVADVARIDTVRLPALVSYRAIREQTRGNPATEPLGQAADKAISLDSSAIAARDTAFAKQGRELRIWQNKPGPPRVQAYAEAQYDLAHLTPVARLGVVARLVGPISLSAAGEYAAPRAGEANPAFRANVGLRYDF